MTVLTHKKKVLSLMFLSVLVPVGLLTSLRLTGLLGAGGEPAVAQTITLDSINWELERPYGPIEIREKIPSSYDNDVAIRQAIEVFLFESNSLYGGSDTVHLDINVTVSENRGYIRDVRLVFHENYENALINIIYQPVWMKLGNLTQTALNQWRSAFINFTAQDRPHGASAWIPVDWVLQSPSNQTHQLDIVSEIVFFNGTVFKRVIQPFHLKLYRDHNNSFETAEELHEGYYPHFWIGPPVSFGNIDPEDFYKINVTKGQLIKVTADGRIWEEQERGLNVPFFNISLYDPNRNLVASKESWGTIETIDAIANSTGYWFIEVRSLASCGFYSLEVSL